MEQKFVTIAVLVCVLVAFVHSAPQLKNRGSRQFQANPFLANPQQPQAQPQQQFHQQPQQQFQQQPRAQVQDPERQSRFLTVSDSFHQDPDTKEYNFEQTFQSGETYNEQGSLKRVTNPEDGEEKDVIVTKGSYTIIEKDGSTVLVNYTADENGFHPEIVTGSPAGRK